MATVSKRTPVNLANLNDNDKARFTAATGLDPNKVPVFEIPVSVSVSLRDFDPDHIADYYAENIADEDTPSRPWFERIYSALAAGDCKEAMDLLHREFDLPSPSHERAVADLISGRKGSAYV